MIWNIVSLCFTGGFIFYTLMMLFNVDRSRMPYLIFVAIYGLSLSGFECAWCIIFLLGNLTTSLKILGKPFSYIIVYSGFELDMIFLLGFLYL